MMNYNKIAIIGIGGSGKSTLGRVIAERSKLPLFHMDNLFWKGNWEAVPEAEYVKAQTELLKQPRWIIEGYVDEPLADRLKEAEFIIYLDYSGLRCGWRVLKRWITHWGKSRAELPKEALERPDLKFLWVVVRRKERERIEGTLQLTKPANLIRVTSPSALKSFLKTFS